MTLVVKLEIALVLLGIAFVYSVYLCLRNLINRNRFTESLESKIRVRGMVAGEVLSDQHESVDEGFRPGVFRLFKVSPPHTIRIGRMSLKPGDVFLSDGYNNIVKGVISYDGYLESTALALRRGEIYASVFSTNQARFRPIPEAPMRTAVDRQGNPDATTRTVIKTPTSSPKNDLDWILGDNL